MAKPKTTPAPAKPNGATDPRVAELKAELERLGFQVRPKRENQDVNAEMLAELKAVVEKHGGTDNAATKATFIKARKELWPISPEQREYNRQQALKRKQKGAE